PFGGQTHMVYGPNTDMVYYGPNWQLHRSSVFHAANPTNLYSHAVSAFDALTGAAMAFLAYRFAHSHESFWARMYKVSNLIHSLTLFIIKWQERKRARANFAVHAARLHAAVIRQQYSEAHGSFSAKLAGAFLDTAEPYNTDQMLFLSQIPSRGTFTRYVASAY